MRRKKPRGPMPEALQVSARQEAILQQITRRAKSPQSLVMRVKVVLAGREWGRRNPQIARDLAISDQTVRLWRKRWLQAKELLTAVEAQCDDQELEETIKQVLTDQPRSGAPPTFTAEQVCQIIALACEAPHLSGRPITAWTPREVADEAVKRGLVRSISTSQVERFLKRGGVAATS